MSALAQCSNCGRSEPVEGAERDQYAIEVCWSLRFEALLCRRCYLDALDDYLDALDETAKVGEA